MTLKIYVRAARFENWRIQKLKASFSWVIPALFKFFLGFLGMSFITRWKSTARGFWKTKTTKHKTWVRNFDCDEVAQQFSNPSDSLFLFGLRKLHRTIWHKLVRLCFHLYLQSETFPRLRLFNFFQLSTNLSFGFQLRPSNFARLEQFWIVSVIGNLWVTHLRVRQVLTTASWLRILQFFYPPIF